MSPDLDLFAAVWLHHWRALGGFVGMIDDRCALAMPEPCDDRPVRMLNDLADSVPGGREAIRARIAEMPFITVHG